MSSLRMRNRLLDLAVATVCVACVCAPMLPIVNAASPSVVESGGSVNQKVLQGGIISNPLNGSFESGRSGVLDGSVQWDLYSTAREGMKLMVSSDRSPAMRDAESSTDVTDYASTLEAWSVDSNANRFGMTAMGGLTLGRFDGGRKWRGFSGKKQIEVGRRGSPNAKTRTTIKLRAELGAGLPANARPTANIRATAVLNL